MSEHSAIFGLEFSPMTRAELASKVTKEAVPAGAGPRSIYTANLDHIVQLRRNPKLRRAYHKAWAVTADGMPVFLYAKIRGLCLRTRVTGADLFGDILASLKPNTHRCFFVASSSETAQLLVNWLLAHGFDRTSIDYDVPPRGFENDAAYSADLAMRIGAHAATHLFFGVGAPKSEIWIDEHRETLGLLHPLRGRRPRLFRRHQETGAADLSANGFRMALAVQQRAATSVPPLFYQFLGVHRGDWRRYPPSLTHDFPTAVSVGRAFIFVVVLLLFDLMSNFA